MSGVCLSLEFETGSFNDEPDNISVSVVDVKTMIISVPVSILRLME